MNQQLRSLRHYFHSARTNDASRARRIGRQAGARKRHMDSITLTYLELQNALHQRIVAGTGPAAASEANLRSALSAFIAERCVQATSVIGSDLRASYYANIAAHLARLSADGRTSEYIRNRKALLGTWRKTLLELDRISASSDRQTPLQLALHELLTRHSSIPKVAKASGVPISHLRSWLKGVLPKPKSAHWIKVLEVFFGLAPGSLTDLLPGAQRESIGTGPKGVQPEIAYRDRMRKVQAEEPFVLSSPNQDLLKQWMQLMDYKTALRLPNGLLRSKKGRWNVTEHHAEKPCKRNEMCFIGDKYVPTSEITWRRIATFLGWLRLPKTRGGAAISPERVQTLVWLTDVKMVDNYINWLIKRSDNIVHEGIIGFLKMVQMLCNPKTGFITQSGQDLSKGSASSTTKAWVAKCKSAYLAAQEIERQLRDEVRPSRNAFEPMAYAFSLPNPLRVVAAAISKMTADRPITGGITEARWARDLLLVKVLASNPLRLKNLQLLTYHSNNTGHLRKIGGIWRIRIESQEFKNARGAAKDRVYDMPIHESVWPDIERYIRDYRPLLAGSDSRYLFSCNANGKPEPWYSMNRHFASITRRYFENCPGTGTHIMRHLVATAILKQQPNAWAAAAWALHDKEETVRKAYIHLASDDAARWLAPVLATAFD